MFLFIDTSSAELMVLALYQNDKLISYRRIRAAHQQAEKLLVSIDALLKGKSVKLHDLKKIIVNNQGSSFTSLRIGVITANTLAYALDIPLEIASFKDSISNSSKLSILVSSKFLKKFAGHQIVEPFYTRQASIGQAKKFNL